MKFIKTPVKGMCDMLPADMRLREHVLGMIKESYGAHGFMEIETPVMEHIENLTSKQGGDNEKLIFKVMKRGAELQRAIEKGDGELADNGLRYDLTVPLARYYANNREKLPVPFKAMQLGNVWRADNPQKGRFRQFTQCDIDILGDDSSLAEIELISATAAISLDKFDKIGLDGIEKDLLAGGYAEEKVAKYMAFYRNVQPGMEIADFCKGVSTEYLPESVGTALADIIGSVKPMLAEGVKLVFDPTLVRGMGYYTGPVFEVTLDGYNFSIAGGGRYDEMIGKFSGQNVSACGFSIGFERIVTILKDHMQGSYKLPEGSTAYLVGGKVPTARKAEVLAQAAQVRTTGVVATVLPMSKNIKHQIELLEAEGFTKFEKIYE